MDHAGLLYPDAASRITEKLKAHEAATTNQVVVVTLPDLSGYSIEERALDLARQWKLGAKDCDNGAVCWSLSQNVAYASRWDMALKAH